MKKLLAIVLALVAVLALAAGVYAAGRLTMEEAKQIALNKAGVTAEEAAFTKAERDFDDFREEYEFEFTANGMEYEVDVDSHTGKVVDFEAEPLHR